MPSFLDLLKESKIKLTNAVIVRSGAEESPHSGFEIDARDFLRFSKQDLREGNERGLINGLTNAKRAIDCQIDECLTLFGIFDKLNQADEFVHSFHYERDIPHKLKIIQSLNLAPGYLISDVRTLRNELEHLYKKPSKKAVQEAIELADLFIRSIEGRVKMVDSDFFLTDAENFEGAKEFMQFDNSLYISFWPGDKEFSIVPQSDTGPVLERKITINTSEKSYYGLLKLMFSLDDQYDCEESFRILLQLMNHPMPPNKAIVTLK